MQAIAVKQPLARVPLNIQIQSLKTESSSLSITAPSLKRNTHLSRGLDEPGHLLGPEVEHESAVDAGDEVPGPEAGPQRGRVTPGAGHPQPQAPLMPPHGHTFRQIIDLHKYAMLSNVLQFRQATGAQRMSVRVCL